MGSFADAFCFLRTVILGDEQGIGVAKFLSRHIGDGVNFHSGGKGCHDGGAKAVDQPLNHQDAEVHDGLLNAGCHIIDDDFPKPVRIPSHTRLVPMQNRELLRTKQSFH